MSRIIAGTAGGQRLTPVPTDATRPTTDRVKEALFSRLESWDVLRDAVVLDLYAGSGALGVEAVSRGATTATLVDQANAAQRALKANASLVSTQRTRVEVSRRSVNAFLSTYSGPDVTLAFLDPPYPLSEEALAETLTNLDPHLAPDAVIVVERSSRSPQPTVPARWHALKERGYGETTLWFYEIPVEEDPSAG
ncbi:16S rRNA (guanine(966)-N(2))-methyltransferase RsmD [Galactobacter sp.]|uniref:16S rRNA (guanine(966)-N(2))-methyltransferase RsmD n=1 Tax=Galactobacter sp. TaxID=2676125 RepID=UPI0025C2DA76|nr:16S rRNA (guanine(966)-N(2))-methyltransferase RsmD [Galactobacter sp.]